MAVDPSIEAFCHRLFHNVWQSCTDRNENDAFPGEVKYRYKSLSLSTQAVKCRLQFFRFMINDKFCDDYPKFSNSISDFCLYLFDNDTDFMAYERLSIFDKVFMTCAVIIRMAQICVYKSIIFKTYAPVCWAMYFDVKLKDEFYAKGGWECLKDYAQCYQSQILLNYLYGYHFIENDLLHARAMLDQAAGSYNLPTLLMGFNTRVLRGKVACQQHLPLWDILHHLSSSKRKVISKIKLIEGYLQLIMRMFTEEDLHDIEINLLERTKSKQPLLSEINNISKHKRNSDVIINSQELNDELDSQVKEFTEQATIELMICLFNNDNRMRGTDQRCMFCGSNINESLKIFTSTRGHRLKKINSVILSTIKNVKLKEEDLLSKSLKISLETVDKEPGIDDVLKLFLTLGVQNATSEKLAKTNEKDSVEIVKSSSNIHVQEKSKGIINNKKSRRKLRKKKAI